MTQRPFPQCRTCTLTRANVERILRTATEPLDAVALAGILHGEDKVTPRHVARVQWLLAAKGAQDP